MGLDPLYIEFRLEEKFGIRILKGEQIFLFDRVQTIEEFVWDKLQGIQPALPVVPRLYVQQITEIILGLPGCRKDRWGWGSLERMIPEEGRMENWERLRLALGMPLPELETSASGSSPTFPRQLRSMGDLVHWIYVNHRDRLPLARERCLEQPPADAERFRREDVRKIVQEVLCEALGVEPSRVTPEARLVEDLGIE